MKMMRSARLLWLMMLMAACIPAQTPDVLSKTPAAGAVITQNRYRNDLFSVEYPEGWRVITSAANAPLSVIFAAPVNDTLIVVSSVPMPLSSLGQGVSCGDPTAFYSRTAALGAQQITLVGCTSDQNRLDEFLKTLDQVTASVRAVS